MALVALISNPHSTGNKAMLPAVRDYCAHHPEVFHYEVEEVGQIAEALRMISRVKPKVLVINGGDGTVQATLTELYHGDHFEGAPPPVAVLPNGKTNLIALDLGAGAKPLPTLERIVELARGRLEDHLVVRQMIALSRGDNERPVLGMFLGGAGLAEFILYCRHKIYPLGLPNGLSHFLAGVAGFISLFFTRSISFLPTRSRPMRVSLIRDGKDQGSYAVFIVTTLDKLLLNGSMDRPGIAGPRLKLLAVDQSAGVIVRAIWASLWGRLGQDKLEGVYIGNNDEIRIDGDRGNFILDGELFETSQDNPIILRSTPPVSFLKLAA